MSLTQQWYRTGYTGLTLCLLPFSWLFRGIVALRFFLYQKQIKQTVRFPVPVIVVGNLTVGGTGKTPFVIWLAQFLRKNGLHPGIVSRGVGGKMQLKPRSVNAESNVQDVGDEAILLAERSGSPVVIGIDRVAAVKELLEKFHCDVVLSDDGLQHYRMGRDIEIALIDGERGLGNQQLLPAGPLREPVSRLERVDFIVRQGVFGANEFGMRLQGDVLVSVKDPSQQQSMHAERIHAVAGIGHPKRFFDRLRALHFDVIEHVFPDHYLFKQDDFLFQDGLMIIMTEKDAVKCRQFADERFWYLPVTAEVTGDLAEKIVQRIRRK